MRNTITISLLLLAFAASANAQEATFGFDDATLDAMPPPSGAYADLVGGTLAVDGSTVRATLELAALPEAQPGVAYAFTFSNGTQTFWAGIATTPHLAYYYGEWNSAEEGPASMLETTGAYQVGAPGTIMIEFPLAYLEGSTVLSSPGGMTADIKGSALPGGLLPGTIVLDTAQSDGEMWLPASAPANDTTSGTAEPATSDAPPATPSGTPTSRPPAAVPGFAASAALGALAGALIGAGRRAR